MNHQPFEEWLLSDDDLSNDQAEELAQHLETCSPCSELDQAWKAVRAEIQSAPMAAPVSGFTQRWQAQLAERRQADMIQKQRRQTWLILSAFSLGSLSLLVVLIAEKLSSYTSLSDMLAAWMINGVHMVAEIFQTQEYLSALFRALPVGIPIFIVGAIALNLALFSLTWVYSMWKIAIPKGVKS